MLTQKNYLFHGGGGGALFHLTDLAFLYTDQFTHFCLGFSGTFSGFPQPLAKEL